MSSIEASANGNFQELYEDVTTMLESSLKKLDKCSIEIKEKVIETLKANDEEIKKKYKQLKRKKKK